MKTKVIVILNRLVVGGPAINTLKVITALKNEYSFLLVTGARENDEREVNYLSGMLKGMNVVHISSLRRRINLFYDLRSFIALLRIIRREKPDIVHTIGAKPGILGRLSARLCNVPVIIHAYHGHVFHSYFNTFRSNLVILIERWAASWTTRIITVSKKHLSELSQVYRIAQPEKFIYIPIGIQIQTFEDKEGKKRDAFRSKYFLEHDEVAIGIVGRLAPVKNHLFFLQVAQKIAGMTLKARFFVIGDGNRLRIKLEQHLKENNIDFVYFPLQAQKAFITFTSWILNMDMGMAGLDIVALTSLNEGTPVSIIEGQAASKPVITTNVGAVEEVMIRDVSGLICDVNTVEEFSSMLATLIRNKQLQVAMGEAGRKHVYSTYALENQIISTGQLYSSLIQK